MVDTVPASVPKDALDFFRKKDLRVAFDAAEVSPQEHAHAFTVAKATKLDIMDDIKSSLAENMEAGETFRTWSKNIKPNLQEKGWWGRKDQIDPLTGETRNVQLGSPRRLKTIYNSNMRSARAAGQWERIERRKESHPYLLYELGPSEQHRPEHVGWAGILLPVDHPWWQSHMPPNGYGCKCRVRAVSRREAERMMRDGIQVRTEQELDDTGTPTGRWKTERKPVRTEAPEIRPVNYTNKRTGEIIQVDQGLHPSWASNPGKDRPAVLRRELNERVGRADEAIARRSARQVVNSPILDQWRTDQQGELPAGLVTGRQAQVISGNSQMVRLTPQLLDQEPTLDVLRALPDLLTNGEILRRDDASLLVFAPGTGDRLRAILTRRQNGDIVVDDIRSLPATDIDQARQSAQVID